MRRNFKIVLTLLLTLAMLACLAGCGAVFTSASANNSGGSGAGSAMMSSMGQMSEEMMGFMKMMRLSDALKMAGDAVSMKTKLEINLALNQIKK